MLQVSPQMRILVATEPVDFRRGVDGMVQACREKMQADPFSGWLFVFRNRRATCLRIIVYDGQGFWLCHKRLSKGRFRYWPGANDGCTALHAGQLQQLLWNEPTTTPARLWRPLPSTTSSTSTAATTLPVMNKKNLL